MYFTKQDNRMILVLVAVVVSHVIITSDLEEHGDYDRRVFLVGAGADDPAETEIGEEGEEPTETMGDVPAEEILAPERRFDTTVSSGVFERNITTPQAQLTSSIFPTSSSEANGKLANARGSFFETLVS